MEAALNAIYVKALLTIIAALLTFISGGLWWGVNKICSTFEKKVDKETCDKVHEKTDDDFKMFREEYRQHIHNGNGHVTLGA